MDDFDAGTDDATEGEQADPAEMPTLRGKFLLAAASLVEHRFARTVVLIVRHDADGALGVIVNRPLGITIDVACSDEVEAARGVNFPLFHGGPCTRALMAVHNVETLVGEEGTLFENETGADGNDDDAEPWGDPVTPGVWFCARRDALEALMRHVREARSEADADGGVAVKFIAGYAGWGAGQLEAELAEGAWQILDAAMADVFAGGGSEKYPAPGPTPSMPPGALGPLIVLAQPLEGGQDPTAGMAAGIRHWVRLSTRANIGRLVDARFIPPDASVN